MPHAVASIPDGGGNRVEASRESGSMPFERPTQQPCSVPGRNGLGFPDTERRKLPLQPTPQRRMNGQRPPRAVSLTLKGGWVVKKRESARLSCGRSWERNSSRCSRSNARAKQYWSSASIPNFTTRCFSGTWWKAIRSCSRDESGRESALACVIRRPFQAQHEHEQDKDRHRREESVHQENGQRPAITRDRLVRRASASIDL